jgi:hypothetical protein
LRERDEKFRLDRCGNFFIGEQFHGGVNLRLVKRLRGGKLFYERFEHTRFYGVTQKSQTEIAAVMQFA